MASDGVNRRLYLVPQFFDHKPIERLIGPGITPEDLNDDCLGRALGWLTAHDLIALFAGLAHQARRRFEVQAEVVHLDSTSFSVEGAYETEEEEEEANEALIRITYGYSRDHRADLKQWQLSLATTTSGVPLGLQVLDGNASDRATLARAAGRSRLSVSRRVRGGTDLRGRQRPLQRGHNDWVE